MNRSILKSLVAGALLWVASAFPSLAQTSPGWTYGYVPTVAQWNTLWSSKQDYLGAPPLLTTGGTMTGRLTTIASTASSAGFNLPPGVAPTSPFDGDLWVSTSGFFARVNGVTIGPIGGATSSSFAASSPLSVSFPAGVVTYACATCGVTTSPLSQFASTTSLQLLGVISDETGTGSLVFGISPSLTTPNIGVATATSVNKVAITAPGTSATLTISNGKTLTDTSVVGASLLLGATGGGFTGFPGVTCTNQALTVLSAAGAQTCSSITNAFLTAGTFSSITGTGTLTAGATGAGFTVALSTSTLTGNLPVANLNGGTGATSSTFWRGDGTWQTPAGAGNVSTSGTPVANQFAQWTSATQIQGVSLASMLTSQVLFQATPGNPSAGGSPSSMAGLGATCKITPAVTGRVEFIIEGYATASTVAGVSAGLRYGTGVAPINGAAVSGTSTGSGGFSFSGVIGNAPVTMVGSATGLALGTQVWFDSFQAANSGTILLQNLYCSAREF